MKTHYSPSSKIAAAVLSLFGALAAFTSNASAQGYDPIADEYELSTVLSFGTLFVSSTGVVNGPFGPAHFEIRGSDTGAGIVLEVKADVFPYGIGFAGASQLGNQVFSLATDPQPDLPAALVRAEQLVGAVFGGAPILFAVDGGNPFIGPATLTVRYASADLDADGVPDDVDLCPDSYLGPTVVINGIDTGVPNLWADGSTVNEDGCSPADILQAQVDAILTGPNPLRQFIRFLRDLNQMVQAGIITRQERNAILVAILRSLINPGGGASS